MLFSVADLRHLPYASDWFNLIYCISVLEHTGDYEKIAREFHRVLRPGGSLVVTMDISLDGTPGIDMQKGTVLLSAFQEQFGGGGDLVHQFRSQWQQPGLFTTRVAQKIDARLVPWYLPWILHRYKTFLTTFRFPPRPPLLSVFLFHSYQTFSMRACVEGNTIEPFWESELVKFLVFVILPEEVSFLLVCTVSPVHQNGGSNSLSVETTREGLPSRVVKRLLFEEFQVLAVPLFF